MNQIDVPIVGSYSGVKSTNAPSEQQRKKSNSNQELTVLPKKAAFPPLTDVIGSIVAKNKTTRKPKESGTYIDALT